MYEFINVKKGKTHSKLDNYRSMIIHLLNILQKHIHINPIFCLGRVWGMYIIANDSQGMKVPFIFLESEQTPKLIIEVSPSTAISAILLNLFFLKLIIKRVQREAISFCILNLNAEKRNFMRKSSSVCPSKIKQSKTKQKSH